MSLKFHWRLLQGGESSGPGVTRSKQLALRESSLPDLDAQAEFCRRAEQAGIKSVLVDINFGKPDPITLAAALGLATESLHYMVAIRSGLLSPTLFVQQVNTVSALTNGRICLNVVAGHSPEEQRFYGDTLPHDERYARTAEFLEVCHAFWGREGGEVNFSGKYFRIAGGRLNTPFVSDESTYPEVFVSGNSSAARDLAIKHGSCWMRLGDAPAYIQPNLAPVLAAGKEVGLRLSVIARPTRAEALRAASLLVENLAPELKEKQREKEFTQKSDSVSIKATYKLAETEWLTPYLWTGAVRSHGAPALAIVGTPDEVASAFIEYRQVGVSQFILSGWPKLDEMVYFGDEVLPLIRQKEAEMSSQKLAEEVAP
jgi:alkanesulfonate monooxygenase